MCARDRPKRFLMDSDTGDVGLEIGRGMQLFSRGTGTGVACLRVRTHNRLTLLMLPRKAGRVKSFMFLLS